MEYDAYDLENIVLSAFFDSYYATNAVFGYVDEVCEEYGEDVSVGIVELTKFADVNEVIEVIKDEFLANGIELVDIRLEN